MYKYSQRSIERLNTTHVKLQTLFKEVIKYQDCSIICGFRNEQDQTKAYINGYSKLKWPKSKHNVYPSNAVDVIPYPTRYSDINKFYQLAGVIKTIAQQMNIHVKWGGSWAWKDYPHYQLIDN